MDWNAVIERNREALKRILAALVARAGLGAGAAPASPLWGEDRGTPQPREATLPRHLHRAILALLRPAEAAARRLIIIAARDLVLPPPRPRKVEPKATPILVRTRIDASMLVPRYLLPQPVSISRPAPRALALPLLDALPRWSGRGRSATRGVMCISIPGVTERVPIPPPPMPGDPVHATRLALRLDALARALDDLPREARRFALWRARTHAAAAQIRQTLDAAGVHIDPRLYGAGAQNRKAHGARRFRRIEPLRPGRPPGSNKRSGHEIHEVLRDLHHFACQALDQAWQKRAAPPDSS